MQFIPLALAGLQAVGSIQAGKAEKASYDAQATAARSKANSVLAAYNQREEAMRRKTRLDAGERRAAMAQTGGLSGSNVDVDRQSMVLSELDALNVRYGGQLENSDLLTQANVFKAQGKNAKAAGYANAAGAVLSGVGSYYGGTLGGKKANSW